MGQMDTSTSLPDDCSGCDSMGSLLQGYHTNPASTTDMSKSPSKSPTPTPTPRPTPTPTPTPGPTPGPAPGPPPPGSHCDRCSELVRENCGQTSMSTCKSCASRHESQWTPISCTVSLCDNAITAAYGGSVMV